MRGWFSRLFGVEDIAIHLGSGHTRVWSLGGLTLEVRAPAESFRPFGGPGGLVSNAEASVRLLKDSLHVRRLGSRVLAFASPDATGEERSAIVQAFERAGAREVLVVPETLAAAVGAGLDLASPYAQMLVDVGDLLTEGTVVADGELVASFTIKSGFGDLSTALRRHLLAHHSLRVDDDAAGALVHRFGVRRCERAGEYVRVSGRDLRDRPNDVWMSRREALGVLEPVVEEILEGVQRGVRELPEETGVQVIESGMCLTGSGAQVPGLAERIGEASGLEVRVPVDPINAVMRGAQGMLRSVVARATPAWRR